MTGIVPDNLHFELAGHVTKAKLATGGEAGLVLDLELRGKRHAFARDQIKVQALGIGTLVTVELERRSEDEWTDFSLLLPSVRLGLTHSTEEHVAAVAVRTTHHKHSVTAAQFYSVQELVGPATLVWSADTFPINGAFRLRVQGILTFPRDGYAVELRRAAQQSANPEIRRLELIVREPSGSTPRSPTTVEAMYEESTGDLQCKTVVVLPEGRSIPVVLGEGIFTPIPDAEPPGTPV
jgi:hypothetical protein